MNKIIKLFSMLFVLGLTYAGTAQAQSMVGVYGGYNVDAEEFFLGGEARIGMSSLPYTFSINPGVETYFIKDVTNLQFNLNGIVDIGAQYATMFVPYLGAGVALNYVDVGDNSDTNFKLNALGGVRLMNMGAIQPFVQARYTFLGDDYVAVQGGILFRI